MRCNSAKCLLYSTINPNKQSQTLLSNQKIIICFQQQNGYRRQFHSSQDSHHSWSFLRNIYDKQLKSANKKYACFLLNVSDKSFHHFERYKYVWNEANLRVSVDGSANFLAKNRIIHTADVVCGDFDSVDPNLIAQLRCPNKASKLPLPKDHRLDGPPLKMPQVIETPCQRETDFTKAIRVAISKRPDIHFYFGLYHSDGSRIDHLFGLVNTLHLVKRDIIIVNIQSNTISWLLASGSHTILKPPGRELCSLVPFTGTAEVKTQGLEYNLGPSSPLTFGGLISTSNICLEDCENIIVDTNRELLWSIDV